MASAPKNARHEVFVGVRLTQAQLQSPTIQRHLVRMDATAIIDGHTARAAGTTALKELTASHIDLGNGGWGHGRPFRFLRAKNDVAKTGDLIRAATGVKVREFVPERRLDAFDQLWCRRRGQRLVEPDHVFRPETVPQSVKDRKIYVLDGRDRDRESLRVALSDFSNVVADAGLSVTSLDELR